MLAFKFVQSLLVTALRKHEQAPNWLINPFVLSHLQREAKEGDQSRHLELTSVWWWRPNFSQLDTEHEILKKVPGLACLDEAVPQPRAILSNEVLALSPCSPPSTKARQNPCLVPRHSQAQIINTNHKKWTKVFSSHSSVAFISSLCPLFKNKTIFLTFPTVPFPVQHSSREALHRGPHLLINNHFSSLPFYPQHLQTPTFPVLSPLQPEPQRNKQLLLPAQSQQ